MKHIKLFEQFVAEAKSFLFSFDYNTDEDDVDYIQSILKDAKVDAVAQPGLDSEEMVVKAKNAVELRKAKNVIQANGFEIYESEEINEARSIEKIEKDRTRVINDMAEIVTNWKAAKQSGDKQAEASFLQRLKDLTAEKNGLEKELNSAIASKDRFIELVISENNTIYEGVMSEIDLLAKEAKNFKEFLKSFKTDNRYKGLDTAGDTKEFEAWLKSIYDNAKMDESIVNEGEDVKKGIHDHWKELYGEDFVSEYPKVAKILKNRQNVDRKELARIWDETYGEDFEEKYPDLWDKLD